MATAYEKVQLARGKGRPSGLSFIQNIFPDFIELHGDRRFADDPAVIGGIATLGGRAVTVIAIEKGADTKDKVYRNFGSPNPEGYRKALRLMKQAEKFHRPVICFVDTSGAFCGIGAEERGQGQAIAENLVEMIGLKTPVISIWSVKAVAAAHLRWRLRTACGFWRTPCIPSFPRRAARAFSGKMQRKRRKPQSACILPRRTWKSLALWNASSVNPAKRRRSFSAE